MLAMVCLAMVDGLLKGLMGVAIREASVVGSISELIRGIGAN